MLKAIDSKAAKQINDAASKALEEALAPFGIKVNGVSCRYTPTTTNITVKTMLSNPEMEPVTTNAEDLKWGLAKTGTVGVECRDNDGQWYPVRITEARRLKYAFEFLAGRNKGKGYVANFGAFRMAPEPVNA